MPQCKRNAMLLASGACSLLMVLPAIPARDLVAQANPVKYVYSIDYPLGQKAAYLLWVQSVAGALQAPDEILRIASYDNYFSGTPQRVIEFEFDNLETAGRYYDRPEITQILEEVVNRGINGDVTVLQPRGDYAGRSVARGAIKYVFALDYPLGQKSIYLEWVDSEAPSLQSEGVRRVTSYDNYFGASPHRFIEFEFNDLQEAARYFERPEVVRVLEDLVNHGINGRMWVLKLRGDYAKQ